MRVHAASLVALCGIAAVLGSDIDAAQSTAARLFRAGTANSIVNGTGAHNTTGGNVSLSALGMSIAAHQDSLVAMVKVTAANQSTAAAVMAWTAIPDQTSMSLKPVSAYRTFSTRQRQFVRVTLLTPSAGTGSAASSAQFTVTLGSSSSAFLDGQSSAGQFQSQVEALLGSSVSVTRTASAGTTAWEFTVDSVAVVFSADVMVPIPTSSSVTVEHTVVAGPDQAPALVAPVGASEPILLMQPPVLAGAEEAHSVLHPRTGTAASGPLLAVSGDWVVMGRPDLFSNSTGAVIIWDRRSGAESAVLTPGVAEETNTPRGGHVAACAVSAVSDASQNPWSPTAWTQTQSPRNGITAGNAAAALPTGAHAALLPEATTANRLRFGAAVALDGSLLAVGIPGIAVPGLEASPLGAAMLFSLGHRSVSTASPAAAGLPNTEAMVATAIVTPDSTTPTGSLSGPHPAARALTGIQSQAARCGSTVALGGGFLAMGCPTLSLPATASTPAAIHAGGIFVFRRAVPLDASTISSSWPSQVPESATGIADLRGEPQMTPAAKGSLNATALLRDSAWVLVQLLVPEPAWDGMRLGGAFYAGVGESDQPKPSGSATGRGTTLVVTSRFLAAVVPTSDSVWVWRRRNGLARAFDPASLQRLRVAALSSSTDATTTAPNITSISLVGSSLVASTQMGAPTGNALAAFVADATGVFRAQHATISGNPDSKSSSVQSATAALGVSAAQCGTGAAGHGVTLAAAGGSAGAALRLVTACGPNASATILGAPSGGLVIMDMPAACPHLAEAPASPIQSAAFRSIAASRQLYAGLEGNASAGECNATSALPILATPVNMTSVGSQSVAASRLLGVGKSSSCVAACGYGSALASGSPFMTCLGTGGWNLFPDELPYCERLLSSSTSMKRTYEPLDPGSEAVLSFASSPAIGSAAALGGMFSDDVLISRLHFAAVTATAGVQLPSALIAGRASRYAANASFVPGASAMQHPVTALRGVLGSARALDGTYMAARGNRSEAPLLSHSNTSDLYLSSPTVGSPGMDLLSRSSLALSPSAASGGLSVDPAGAAGASSATAIMLADMVLNSSAVVAADPTRLRPSVPGAAQLPSAEASILGHMDMRAVLTVAEATHAVLDRTAPGPRGQRQPLNVTCAGPIASCVSTQPWDGDSLSHEARGPAADPRIGIWAAPAHSLDPLMTASRSIDAAVALPASRPAAVRSTPVTNTSAPSANANVSDVAVSSPLTLASALPAVTNAAGTFVFADLAVPYIRFHPSGLSPLQASVSQERLAHEGDAGVAGYVALSDGDPLGSEAMLAPMTWHNASADIDVTMTGTGDGALGGTPLLTTIPLRMCCATGRGRVPADGARRRAGPQRTRVVLSVMDMYSVSDWTQALSSDSSASFLDAVLAQISIRLGNVSAAVRWAGLQTANSTAASHVSIQAGGQEQIHTTGTAALDVPGAYVTVVRPPQSTYAFAPAKSVNSASRITGQSLPSLASGTSLELEVSGYGFGDPSDRSDGCRSLMADSHQPWVSQTPAVQFGQARRNATVGLNRQRGWQASSTLTWQMAADFARIVLRAARQPVSWWVRRRCVAADLRTVVPASPDAGVPWRAEISHTQ